jgi:hypothetical protein
MNVDLNAAGNFHGPLSGSIRLRLRALLDNPTPETWDDAKGIVLCAAEGLGLGLSLWQAVIAVDPAFPRVGRHTDVEGNVVREWERIPTTELLEQAIAYATH